MPPLLEVRDLVVAFDGPRGEVRAVDGVTFAIDPGETYALVGESGCGKSMTAFAIVRLAEPGTIVSGSVRLEGEELISASERRMCEVRGSRVGIVFQEPGAALNPVMRIGTQVGESLRIHRGLSKREAWREAVRLLGTVALPDPERQARSYPHELSGGMAQRVMLAIALSCSPALLIADEPTSALDVTVQAQVLALLRTLKKEYGLTILLIAHDLAVVAENADRVGVMYAGKIAEEADCRSLFHDPKHPYTRALLRAREAAGTATPGRRLRLSALPGSVPDPSAFPPGCRFHPRCPERFEPCDRVVPPDAEVGPRHRASCLLHDTARAEGSRS